MENLTEYNSKEMNNHETNHKIEKYGEPPNHLGEDHMKKNGVEKPSSAENGDEIVVFNIGGEIFETFRETIRKDNISVLSDDNFLRRYYRAKAGVYFFDRDPDCFRVCTVNILKIRTAEKINLECCISYMILKRTLPAGNKVWDNHKGNSRKKIEAQSRFSSIIYPCDCPRPCFLPIKSEFLFDY